MRREGEKGRKGEREDGKKEVRREGLRKEGREGGMKRNMWTRLDEDRKKGTSWEEV